MKPQVIFFSMLVLTFFTACGRPTTTKKPGNVVEPIVRSADGSCTYNGTTYQNYEGFQCDCNVCQCNDGQILSTMIACGMF